MNYVVHYSVASILFLGIFIWYYVKQKRIPSMQNSIFRLMLFFGMLAVVLDVGVVLFIGHKGLAIRVVSEIGNVVFLIASQIGPALFFAYSLVITGNYSRIKKWTIVAYFIPLAVVVFSLLISPFTTAGAYYLDQNNCYHFGALHSVLYISAGIYLLSSLIHIIRSRRRLGRRKIMAIGFFLVASATAMGLQVLYPNYLLNQTANVISLILIYYALETPKDHIDPLTGGFNNMGLNALVSDSFEQGRVFKLVFISIINLRGINQQFGRRVGDGVLEEFYEILHRYNVHRPIARVDGDSFCIIDSSDTSPEEMMKEWGEPKNTLTVYDNEIELEYQLGIIASEDCSDAFMMLRSMDYIAQGFNLDKNQRTIIADKAFYARYEVLRKQEKALEKAIAGNSIEVFYQPIHSDGKNVKCLEALARLKDSDLGYISPDVFIIMAEKNGTIVTLGRQVYEKVVQFIASGALDKTGVEYISVNLSVGQCMNRSTVEDFVQIARSYGVPSSNICFEITETESAESAEAIIRTMKEFKEFGFHFSLDDFGTGYANFTYLFKLPFKNIKIDKSILWDAIDNPRDMELFKSVVGIVKNLGLVSICEGVETLEQAELLHSLGVDLHQGFLYSKPLSQEDLIKYLSQFAE